MIIPMYQIIKNTDGEEKIIYESSDKDAAQRELDRCEIAAEHDGSFTYVSYEMKKVMKRLY